MNEPSAVRRLGDGFEPHVDEQGGVLVYSLPVESSVFTAGFSFEIQDDDLTVLQRDPYRRAVLNVTAHTVLQQSMQRGAEAVSQRRFDDLVAKVLHSTPEELSRFLARFDVDHHMVTRIFVDQIMARMTDSD